MDPFGASSKGNVYQESGLDSERRFRKSQSFNSAGRHGGVGSNGGPSAYQDPEPSLRPFDYPSPSVSAASSSASEFGCSPSGSPDFAVAGCEVGGSPLEPAIQLGPPLFPAELFGRPLAAPGPSASAIADRSMFIGPSTGFPLARSKPRKDNYDLTNLPTPLLRTTSSTQALPLRRPVDPRAAEEARWQAAMTKGFDQVASGRVEIQLSQNKLTFIPVTVTDMNNYIAMASPALKEYKGLSHGRNYASPHRSPVTSPRIAPATRTFSRVSSAPASTTAAQANLAALQGRRSRMRAEPNNGSRPGSPAFSSSASTASTSTSASTIVGFATTETPPSSPLSASTAGTAPRARLLPGRPPSPGRMLGNRAAAGRAVTFAPVAASPNSPAGGRLASQVPIELSLDHNEIRCLPSQLFELKKLTHLDLRNNHLTSLPAAISALVNLESLSIGGNSISYLPSTILTMTHLKRSSVFPNPFLKRPTTASASTSASSTTTTTTTTATTLLPSTHPAAAQHPVPSLYELCLRRLLSQERDPTGKTAWLPPALLTAYPDLLTSGALASADILCRFSTVDDEDELVLAARRGEAAFHLGFLTERDASRILACVRSAAPDKFKPSAREAALEDASDNPYFEPCPDPRLSDDVRRVFLTPHEERLVWSAIPGGSAEQFPIRFRGSTVGSLAFLDGLESQIERGASGEVDDADDEPVETPVEDDPTDESADQVAQPPSPPLPAEGGSDDGFDLSELDQTPAF